MLLRIVLLVTSLSLAVAAMAQSPITGLPPHGSFAFDGFDAVNLSNLNVNFSIPIVSSPGRGIPLSHSVVYDSTIWQRAGSAWSPVTDANGNPTFGWKTTAVPGSIPFTFTTYMCSDINTGDPVVVDEWNGYSYVDPQGTSHDFGVDIVRQIGGNCGLSSTGSTGYAIDASGYYLNATAAQTPIVYTLGGVKINSSGNITDPNGNEITPTLVNSSETDWTDSTGRIALKIITAAQSIQYKVLDPTGAYQTITLNLQSLNIKTNFQCSGVVEYTGTATLPVSLVLPNSQTYSFSYEPTPGNSGYYTGRLQRVTMPAGGYYEFDYSGSNDGVNCADGTTLRMNQVVSDGTNLATWNYVRNTSSLTTTITTPKLADTPNANDTVVTFNSSGKEISRTIYQDSPGATVLRVINTTWAANGTPATLMTVLENQGIKSEIDTTYDSNGLLDSITEYDWGTGAHGSTAPIRTMTFTYQTSTNYTSRNILNLVTSKQIKNGSGTVQYRQDTTYDGVALTTCPAGAAQHDDSGYSCTFNYRGNPTSVTTYLTPGTPANGITKNLTYDWFGNLRTAQLNCCQNKSWSYSSTTQYSLPDSITRGTSPTQLTTTATYNAYTGQIATATDENNLVTSFSYDILRRPTQVSQSIGSTNGESVSYSYDDAHFTTTSTTTIDSSKSIKQIFALDGLGRPITSTTTDVGGNVISVLSAQYDLVGRAYKTSNPYTGTSTSYWSATQFDVLGRPTSITAPAPDSSVTTISYATNSSTVTDPVGKQHKSVTDAAGRLVTVYEPDPSNNNTLTLQTSYAYNVLNELTGVTQGSQTRTYVYDALGRLNSVTTPERGRVCFGSVSGTTCNTDGYDSFDNLLKRTDARGVLTSYGYDTLNRLTSITYNVGTTGVPATATVNQTYGSTPSSYNNGRLITMTDGAGSENYTYNDLGQLAQLQKTISGTTYTISYNTYNLANELAQITYPSGRVVQQSVDSVGRLCEIAPSTTGCGTAANPYATNFGYNAASEVTGFKYGNAIFASFGFAADRLQLNCLDYSTTNRNGSCTHDSTTKLGLTYSYGSTGSNNGQIASITDYVDNGRSATYTYDSLYRLIRTVTAGSSGYPAWGLSETYDRYGNRSAQGVYSGCTGITCPTNSVTISAVTNQITGSPYAYDPSGNMTNDGNNTLIYDGESRAVSATNGGGSGTYTYDGNGLRVKKASGTTTTVYIFSGSQVIAEYDNGAAVSSPSREYIYSGATLIAKIDSSGTKYYHQDHLSNRLITDSSGNTIAQQGHFPFGEQWYPVPPASPATKWEFTTYERDAESGNDYALARYYINRLARFSSPDPVSGTVSNPQSLNRYSYSLNDPGNLTDPLGLSSCDPTLVTIGECGGSSSELGLGGSGWNDLDLLAAAFDPTGTEMRQVDISHCPPGGECSPWQEVPVYGNIGLVSLIGQEPPDLGPPLWLANMQNPLLLPTKGPPPPIYCQPDVIAQMIKAFEATGNGTRGNEAGFAVNGSPANYSVDKVTVGQERGILNLPINIGTINPTFALFHVHPNGGGAYPSSPQNNRAGSSDKGDTLVADRYGFATYVMSTQGLTMYDPWSKKPQPLRSNLDWTKPCF